MSRMMLLPSGADDQRHIDLINTLTDTALNIEAPADTKVMVLLYAAVVAASALNFPADRFLDAVDQVLSGSMDVQCECEECKADQQRNPEVFH